LIQAKVAVQKAKVETSNDHRPTIKAVFLFIATTESKKNLRFFSVVAGYPHRGPYSFASPDYSDFAFLGNNTRVRDMEQVLKRRKRNVFSFFG
jgi:hypothetical protein